MPFIFSGYLSAPTGNLGTNGTSLTVNLGTQPAQTVRFELVILGQITSRITYFSPDADGQLPCVVNPTNEPNNNHFNQFTWATICQAVAHFPAGNQQLVFTIDTSGTTGTQTISRAVATAWTIATD